ncbi:MAG TPA: hypothetical protein VGS23_01625 [Thermoplasmata archaeon]|nr:hypothetical protein [Thermoplasmata archaeon]
MPKRTAPPKRRPPSHRGRPARPPERRPTAPSRDPITPSYIPPETSAHAICRVCGRILRVSIAHEEVATLQSFSDRRPDGWTVEGMSFSFTGICPQCRQGRPE